MAKRKERALSLEDKLIVKLHSFAKKVNTSSNDRQIALSLLKHNLIYKELSFKQRQLAERLTYVPSGKEKVKAVNYSLYAIDNGDSIKIGVSTDIGKRLKALQTGSNNRLSVVWKCRIGTDRKAAYTAERKAHRLCKKHKVRGEWFNKECLTIIEEFKFNSETKRR